MRAQQIRKWVLNSFWVSVFLHLLLLLSFSTVILFHREEKHTTPHLYVPSYVYTGSVNPALSQSHPLMNTKMASSTQTAAAHKHIPQHHTLPKKTDLVEKPEKKAATPNEKRLDAATLFASTRQVLEENQRQALSADQSSEPIYLVGDDTAFADPLIKLIGKSLSAHFEYPRMAGELGIKGRVIVGLTLHPEGYFSNVQMLQSSHSQDLDAAALYAVNSAPSVIGANRFLSKPKHFTIGFIFK